MSAHVGERLSEYLDGVLSDAQRRPVEEHLAACPGCRERLDELKSLSTLLSGLPRAQVPSSLIGRVRLAGRETPAAVSPALPRRLAWTAAVFMAGLVAYEGLRESEPRTAATVSPMADVGPPPADAPRTFNQGGKARQSRGLAVARGKPIPETEPAQAKEEGLAAPAAPKLSGVGSAVGASADAEAPAPAPGYTNEQLVGRLEAERKKMGITGMSKPRPSVRAEVAEWVGSRYPEYQALRRAAPPAPIAGEVPALLAAGSGGGAGLGSGAPMAELMQRAPPASVGPRAGLAVARTPQELAQLWPQLGRPGEPPAVDFSRDMVVAVRTDPAGLPVAIVSTGAIQGGVFVRWRVAGEGDPITAYRVVPKSDLRFVLVREQ